MSNVVSRHGNSTGRRQVSTTTAKEQLMVATHDDITVGRVLSQAYILIRCIYHRNIAITVQIGGDFWCRELSLIGLLACLESLGVFEARGE